MTFGHSIAGGLAAASQAAVPVQLLVAQQRQGLEVRVGMDVA